MFASTVALLYLCSILKLAGMKRSRKRKPTSIFPASAEIIMQLRHELIPAKAEEK